MYDESEGKVLLLAVAENCEPSAFGTFTHHQRLRRTMSSRAGSTHSMHGPGSGFFEAAAAAAAAAATADEMARRPKAGKKRKKNVEEEKECATVDVFPDKSFRFTIDCHLLVLAQTQTLAEDLVFNFQVSARSRACILFFIQACCLFIFFKHFFFFSSTHTTKSCLLFFRLSVSFVLRVLPTFFAPAGAGANDPQTHFLPPVSSVDWP